MEHRVQPGKENTDLSDRGLPKSMRMDRDLSLRCVQNSVEPEMPIFRWGQTWDPFRDLEREVDRLLQGVNMTLHGVRFGRRFPQVNLLELQDSFVLTAEIPGIDLKQLEVTTASGYLTIKGIRLPPEEARDDAFRRQERFHGPWQRTIQLPDRVDEDGMTADYTAGILRVTLPKAPSTAPRQIKVNEGS